MNQFILSYGKLFSFTKAAGTHINNIDVVINKPF